MTIYVHAIRRVDTVSSCVEGSNDAANVAAPANMGVVCTNTRTLLSTEALA